MKTKVTREDIQQGARGQPNGCPVALAIVRVFPEGNPSVKLRTASIGICPDRKTYNLPGRAMGFIRHFDRESKVLGWVFVCPFTFEIGPLV